MTRIAIVFHSEAGHVARVAEAVAEGARGAGATVDLVGAADLHDAEAGPWDALHAADAIVFGSPTYFGSVSGTFERFADQLSPVWLDGRWRDKAAAGFVCSASLAGDKWGPLTRMWTLAMQLGMVWVGLGLLPGDPRHPDDDPENLNRLGVWAGAGVQAGDDADPDEEPGPGDLATARHLGRRVAEMAGRLAAG